MLGRVVLQVFQETVYLVVQVVEAAVVLQTDIGHPHAGLEVLLVRVGILHFPLLVGQKSLEINMVGFRTPFLDTLVTQFRLGIDRYQNERTFLAQGLHFAHRPYAFDDGIAPVFGRLLENGRSAYPFYSSFTESMAERDSATGLELYRMLLSYLSNALSAFDPKSSEYRSSLDLSRYLSIPCRIIIFPPPPEMYKQQQYSYLTDIVNCA